MLGSLGDVSDLEVFRAEKSDDEISSVSLILKFLLEYVFKISLTYTIPIYEFMPWNEHMVNVRNYHFARRVRQ